MLWKLYLLGFGIYVDVKLFFLRRSTAVLNAERELILEEGRRILEKLK